MIVGTLMNVTGILRISEMFVVRDKNDALLSGLCTVHFVNFFQEQLYEITIDNKSRERKNARFIGNVRTKCATSRFWLNKNYRI